MIWRIINCRVCEVIFDEVMMLMALNLCMNTCGLVQLNDVWVDLECVGVCVCSLGSEGERA